VCVCGCVGVYVCVCVYLRVLELLGERIVATLQFVVWCVWAQRSNLCREKGVPAVFDELFFVLYTCQKMRGLVSVYKVLRKKFHWDHQKRPRSKALRRARFFATLLGIYFERVVTVWGSRIVEIA
jgi:hypothetical protein